MREKRLLLNVELYFSPVETASSKQGVLGKNTQKNNLRKTIILNKREASSVREIRIMNLVSLDIASCLEKRAKMKRSTTLSMIITRMARKSERSNSQ